MRSLIVLLVIVGLTITARAQEATKLYRYYNTATGGHFYTTSWEELGEGKWTFKPEGVAGYAFSAPANGTTPVFRYYNTATKAHFYTTAWEELGVSKWTFVLEGCIDILTR